MSSWIAANFQNLAMVGFGGTIMLYGLRGAIRRELIFVLGRGKGSPEITLQGNYAIGGGIGMTVSGLLFVLSVMLRNQFGFSDALNGIFFAVGFGILIASLVLSAIFQWAVLLGRGKQPTEEE